MRDINIDFDRVADLYDTYVNCTFDLDFWRGVAQRSTGPRLELMCGTGRIALAILRDGKAIDGLDYSAKLLEKFRGKLASEGLARNCTTRTRTRFDLGRRYGLIVLGFHSIAEVLSDGDKRRVFRNVDRHLADEGEFWISIHNPPHRRAGLDGTSRLIGTYRLPSGEELHVSGEYLLDEGTQVATGRQVYRCVVAGSQTRLLELPVRFHLISPTRLDDLLASAGLCVTQQFGSYGGGKFDPVASSVYLARCRRG